jgi:integrase
MSVQCRFPSGSRNELTIGHGHRKRYLAVCSTPLNKAGVVWGEGPTEKVVWYVVKNFAKTVGLDNVAPHYLRRTRARLCHVAGGELEQIQFLLGPVSVQTTERYLGCKQRIRDAVNDRIGIEPAS